MFASPTVWTLTLVRLIWMIIDANTTIQAWILHAIADLFFTIIAGKTWSTNASIRSLASVKASSII
jgi:hypothetical protein